MEFAEFRPPPSTRSTVHRSSPPGPSSEYGLAPGQELRAEKSDESTAITELLRKIDVRGGIVTIDAMGARKAISAEVIRGEAD
jgi:hypothetical protein